MGEGGSGSFDFRLDEVHVPAELTFERAGSARQHIGLSEEAYKRAGRERVGSRG